MFRGRFAEFDGRTEVVRFNREHGAADSVQDDLRGVTHEHAGEIDPPDRAHDDDVDFALGRELRYHLAGISVQQMSLQVVVFDGVVSEELIERLGSGDAQFLADLVDRRLRQVRPGAFQQRPFLAQRPGVNDIHPIVPRGAHGRRKVHDHTVQALWLRIGRVGVDGGKNVKVLTFEIVLEDPDRTGAFAHEMHVETSEDLLSPEGLVRVDGLYDEIMAVAENRSDDFHEGDTPEHPRRRLDSGTGEPLFVFRQACLMVLGKLALHVLGRAEGRVRHGGFDLGFSKADHVDQRDAGAVPSCQQQGSFDRQFGLGVLLAYDEDALEALHESVLILGCPVGGSPRLGEESMFGPES